MQKYTFHVIELQKLWDFGICSGFIYFLAAMVIEVVFGAIVTFVKVVLVEIAFVQFFKYL